MLLGYWKTYHFITSMLLWTPTIFFTWLQEYYHKLFFETSCIFSIDQYLVLNACTKLPLLKCRSMGTKNGGAIFMAALRQKLGWHSRLYYSHGVHTSLFSLEPESRKDYYTVHKGHTKTAHYWTFVQEVKKMFHARLEMGWLFHSCISCKISFLWCLNICVSFSYI
jgi:hypothetical protein